MGRTTNINREELAEMYRSGMSQRDIANAIGVNQTTVSYNLRKFGICVGKGQGMGDGGIVSRTIPEKDFKVADTAEKEKQEMAQKNAANACLLVVDNVITLEGVIGRYEISRKDKKVLATINGDEFDFTFEQVMGLCDEFRALARNLDSVEAVGAEMW